MKTLTFCLAASFFSAASTAYAFDISTATPALSFPKDAPGGESVTKEKRVISN